MTNTLRRLRSELFTIFVAESRLPPTTDLAARLTLAHTELMAMLEQLEQQHLIALDPQTREPWMLHPFSNVETAYRVVTDAPQVYFANCAWDALAIPSLLGQPATVEAHWSDDNSPLSIRVTEDGLEPSAGFVHFQVPPRDFWTDVGFT